MASAYSLAVFSALLIVCSSKVLLWQQPAWKIGSTPTQMLSGWGGASFGSSSDRVDVVADPAGTSGGVLRVTYPQGSYNSDKPGGAAFNAKPFAPQKAAYLAYEVFFDNNFQWVKGGKLPGFFGGATTCSAGRDTDAQHCFSSRLMWQRNGAGILYFYLTQNQRSDFCTSPNVACYWADHRASMGVGHPDFTFKKGSWNKVEQYIKVNAKGTFDGAAQVWVNGKLVVNDSKIAVYSDGAGYIDGIMFSTFFGGSDATWATPVTTYTYYKNFKVYV